VPTEQVASKKEIMWLQHRYWRVSKRFCDIFTDAATGAARCDFFVEEDFNLLIISYG
jgi:hypothetical protein